MLSPKKVKFRKRQKGRMRGMAKGGSRVDFGDFGLQATGCGWITARQIEAARVAINRHVKRGGKLYIRIFPDKPISKKPAEVRMGKGKGNPGGVGLRGSARPGDVRARGRQRGDRAPGVSAGAPQAAGADADDRAGGAPMKVEEVRQRTDEELSTLVKQLGEDLYTLRVQRATNQLENTSAIRNKRRDLARVMTVLKARTKGIEKSTGAGQ